jgi:hypothetical protein
MLIQKRVVHTKLDNYVFIIKCKLQSRLVSKSQTKYSSKMHVLFADLDPLKIDL